MRIKGVTNSEKERIEWKAGKFFEGLKEGFGIFKEVFRGFKGFLG